MKFKKKCFPLQMFVFCATAPQWARASSFTRFLNHTKRRTTVGKTPLDEWSARPRDLYLTTHNTHHRQASMPPVGLEHTISAGVRPQTYALDRSANGMLPTTPTICVIPRLPKEPKHTEHMTQRSTLVTCANTVRFLITNLARCKQAMHSK